jgi:DNA-binding beta-propeller fold protein YncE
VDTVIALPGAPYGAAATTGMALVTLHRAAMLARWDFRRRTLDPFNAPTGREPTNVAIAPGGRAAFVASQYSFRVDRIDLERRQIDGAWHTPANEPFQAAVSPDGRLVFATGNAGFLYFFDARTGLSHGAVQVSAAPNGLAVSSDGSRVYVTHLRSAEIGVVEVGTERYHVLGRMDDQEGQGIVLSPDGKVVYAVSENAGELCAFDAVTGARLALVRTGPSPFGLALTPDGTELWVTTLTGKLLRYRRDDLTLISGLELGGRLRRLAFEPRGLGAVIADESGRIIVMR